MKSKNKLTESYINKTLTKIWDGGFDLNRRYIKKDILQEHLDKLASYKKKSYKIKYQKRVFGISDGESISVESLIKLINRVINVKKGTK